MTFILINCECAHRRKKNFVDNNLIAKKNYEDGFGLTINSISRSAALF